jgi:glycerophosphoryl diester phosphodiesterase
MSVCRVGHKGADLIAPGNTIASFDAALATGVDMIEFDVLPALAGDGLVIAHDRPDLSSQPLPLERGLEYLAGPRFAAIELDVDLKLPGYELRALAALRAHGLLQRSLISSMYPASLAVLRAAEPPLRLGWSVPNLRHDPFRNPLLLPAAAAIVGIARMELPRRAADVIRRGSCSALMAHWRLVSPRLVTAVREAGGELYVWTVDDRNRIRRLERMGVTGVISDDPRLFDTLV